MKSENSSTEHEKLPGRVLHIDKDRDLALLSTRLPPSATEKKTTKDEQMNYMAYIRDLAGYIKLPFARDPVKILDKTYVFGCPEKYASSATAGIISHVKRHIKNDQVGF